MFAAGSARGWYVPKRRPAPTESPSATSAREPDEARRPVLGVRAPEPATAATAGLSAALKGGRLSVDIPGQFLGALTIVVPPDSPEDLWTLFALDEQSLARMSPSQLLDLLVDLSPDVSRALWDILRLCNPGWQATCFRPGGRTPDPAAQARLDAFLDQLTDLYGAVDVPIGRLFIGAFMRGAFLAELVLDESARTPIDFATPDPMSIRFRREWDPVRGPVWHLGQWQVSGFVPLERPTIRYAAIDPLPGRPYGRPLAAAALFPTLFLLGLMHDLRRVIAQQGYPRIDITLDLVALQASMPPQVRQSPEKEKAWVQEVITEIGLAYSKLEPDDAYLHTSVVKVNRSVGTVDATSLGGITAIIQALERMAVRALKTMPIMMGLVDGSSEANANRQWEIEAAGVRSLQNICETLLGRLFAVGLRAQGIQAVVEVAFEELRAAQALRDAQVEQLTIANAGAKYDRGWVSQDEAALEVTGHPADQPEPRVLPLTDQPTPGEGLSPAPDAGAPSAADTGQVNPEPGENRSAGRLLAVVGGAR